MCSNLKCSKSFRTGVPGTRNQGLVQGREKPRSETWRVDFRSFAIVWSWTWLLKNPKILNFGKIFWPCFQASKIDQNKILKIAKRNSKCGLFTWKLELFENLFLHRNQRKILIEKFKIRFRVSFWHWKIWSQKQWNFSEIRTFWIFLGI